MRLIDADAWIEEHCEGCGYMESGFCTKDDPMCGAVEVTNEMPTIDAVEVVRCKDCKHYGYDPYDNGEACCVRWGEWIFPNDDDF